MAKTNGKKIGRNSPCPCDSGLKYKYCCIGKVRDQRLVPSGKKCPSCNEQLNMDMTDDIINILASESRPLKNFCKDNDIYLFGILSMRDFENLTKSLEDQTLKKEDILNVYINCATEKTTKGLLEDAIEEYSIFKERKEILLDAFNAHYEKKYTLSIPTLFTQLEGLLRTIGNLKNKDNIRPTIKKDIWDKKQLFTVKDDSNYFSGFIQKLFEGSKEPEAFNRNPILHGFKIDYYSESHSLLLIMSIIEIRMFKWWEDNIDDFGIPKELKK